MGKILKVSNNDLYGNSDDREVVVFAVFNHLKYMNKYIIFAFNGQYDKKKICYGSVHIKNNSLVAFSVKNGKEFIDKFVDDFVNNKVDSKEYELVDISDKSKIELVSYDEYDFDKLAELDKMTITREVVTEEEGKPVFLYFLLIFMFLLLGGITYFYFNPDMFTVELKKMDCTANLYDKKLSMHYDSTITILFDEDDKFKSADIVDVYKFDSEEAYLDFKDNGKETEYFNVNGGYKYDDEKLELRVIYSDKIIIEEYKEVKTYFKNEGYSCIEGKYYE